LGAFSALAVAPLSPFLLESLHLSRVQVGFLLPALYLGGVMMSLPAGWLTDRLGIRLTLALGLILTGTMVALATTSQRILTLLALLCIGGFGMSAMNPASGKAVLEWFSQRERGLAMGIKQTGFTLGGVAGALILPPIASNWGWRHALVVAGAASVASALLVVITYRSPSGVRSTVPTEQPRLAEIKPFLRRPGVLVVFGSGLALSLVQSSLTAYLVLYAKETFAISAVAAGRLLALAQIGGTAARLVWGFVSDRFFGGRRRPGVVINTLIGALACIILAFGEQLSPSLAAVLAVVAGAGTFGWVGLYFALVAEIGGARYAGLLTGAAVSFAWSGVLIGPPIFGLVLEASDSYTLSWLLLAGVAVLVSFALFNLQPVVQRTES
jgi:sugar phosphate permease